MIHLPLSGEATTHRATIWLAVRPLVMAAVSAGGVGVLATITGVATYDEVVDGSRRSFTGSILLGVLTALLVSLWHTARGGRLVIAIVLSCLALAPSAVVHTVRRAHREASLDIPLPMPPAMDHRELLTLEIGERSSVQILAGALEIHAPAGSTGYVRVRAPEMGSMRWDLPRALFVADHPRVTEEFRWRAAITLTGSYFGLVELDRLNVQVTAWGLLITQRTPSGAIETSSIPISGHLETPRAWALSREAGALRLRLEEQMLWSGPEQRPFHSVKLGETKSDREHGGTMRLSDVRFSRQVR